MTRARLLTCLIVAAASLTALPAQAQEEGNTAERVRIAWPRDDGTLTPYTYDVGYPLMTLIYDTLLWRDEGGSAEEWLARQIRNTEAGRRVTVTLREGARFHDGRPLTAEDVKFSYDYFAERYQSRFTPQLQAIESVDVVDELTVAFNLEYPSPGFNLPLSDVPILPRHLWEGLGPGETPPGMPVGSGPYRLVERSPGERYVFRANDDYFLGQPRVATLELPFDSDFAGTVRSLLNRDVDMIPVTLPQGTQDDVTGPGFRIDRGVLYSGTALTFNVRKPPFDSVRARRAISSALDLQRIADNTVGANERAFQADRGYVHPRSGAASEGPLHRFEPERARSELAALDLPQIRVLAPDNDPIRNVAGQQVVLALTRAGADAELVTVTPGELNAAVDPEGGTPTFEAAIASIPPLASYSADYLPVVFGSDERQAPLNYSGYSSEEFDRLAARAARETNPRERSQTIRSELRLLAQEDVPVVPLFYPEGAFVYRDSIYQGWTYIEGTGILDKRSFLPREISAEAGARPNAAPIDRASGSGGGIGALGLVALSMLGLVVIVLVLGVVRRRP
ncbi:MAG: ABC transporter substrate-binding protein [Solirubrobacteraceae bacterium MAG38_C4-C5]|nr:ABC transporter substrate-binding protein [Candidatus Siliceabacter maunaloa]